MSAVQTIQRKMPGGSRSSDKHKLRVLLLLRPFVAPTESRFHPEDPSGIVKCRKLALHPPHADVHESGLLNLFCLSLSDTKLRMDLRPFIQCVSTRSNLSRERDKRLSVPLRDVIDQSAAILWLILRGTWVEPWRRPIVRYRDLRCLRFGRSSFP